MHFKDKSLWWASENDQQLQQDNRTCNCAINGLKMIPNAGHSNPSIHFHPLNPGSGHGGSRPSRLTQASLWPATLYSLLWGIPRTFPGNERDIILPVCPGSSLGSPPSWTCLENLLREASRKHPDEMPNPLRWLLSVLRLHSKLPPDVRAPYPISQAERGLPTEETHFSHLYPRPRSFGHDPEFVTTGEGRNVDRPINWELCLSAQFPLPQHGLGQCPFYCCRRPDPPVDLPLHLTLTRKQDPKILSTLSPPGGSNPTVFGRAPWPQIWRCWLSSPPLHTRLHNAPVNAGGHGFRMLTGPHNLQTAERRSRDHPNLTCSTPRLHLDILSMKIPNRTGDKGQPWQRPTPTGNVSDLMPRMQTQLLLQLTAIKGPVHPN